jgi:hypothetical protein
MGIGIAGLTPGLTATNKWVWWFGANFTHTTSNPCYINSSKMNLDVLLITGSWTVLLTKDTTSLSNWIQVSLLSIGAFQCSNYLFFLIPWTHVFGKYSSWGAPMKIYSHSLPWLMPLNQGLHQQFIYILNVLDPQITFQPNNPLDGKVSLHTPITQFNTGKYCSSHSILHASSPRASFHPRIQSPAHILGIYSMCSTASATFLGYM